MRRGGASPQKRIQAGRAASNRPDLSRFVVRDTEPRVEPVEPADTRTDWPAISGMHPTYWHVHRVEIVGGVRRLVLIAERRTEHDAFAIAAEQRHQCRVSRWSDRRAPYYSPRPPLVVA